MTAGAPPDPTCCPLCGNANACAMAAAEGGRDGDGPPCWCRAVEFTESLRQRVPAVARQRACICADCAAAARREATPLQEPTPCP